MSAVHGVCQLQPYLKLLLLLDCLRLQEDVVGVHLPACPGQDDGDESPCTSTCSTSVRPKARSHLYLE